MPTHRVSLSSSRRLSRPSIECLNGEVSVMAAFEHYLEEANKAKTPEELFDIFLKHLRKYGYDKVLFALITDHKDIDLKAGIGVLRNYPADWMAYYFENEFDKIDPVATYALHQSEVFEWSAIGKNVELLPVQKKCLNMGIEAGLNNGIGLALRGPNNQVAGIGLASSEKKDACEFNADLITAYCNHFYAAYKRLHQKVDLNPQNIVLTNREREILKWTATGKTDDEISDILKISRHTVNMHFRHIYGKLDANNRIFAVVKALNCGLVTL